MCPYFLFSRVALRWRHHSSFWGEHLNWAAFWSSRCFWLARLSGQPYMGAQFVSCQGLGNGKLIAMQIEFWVSEQFIPPSPPKPHSPTPILEPCCQSHHSCVALATWSSLSNNCNLGLISTGIWKEEVGSVSWHHFCIKASRWKQRMNVAAWWRQKRNVKG